MVLLVNFVLIKIAIAGVFDWIFSVSMPRLTCEDAPQSIFCLVFNLKLPIKRIEKIDLKLDLEKNVERIQFTINNSELLFVPGEVY